MLTTSNNVGEDLKEEEESLGGYKLNKCAQDFNIENEGQLNELSGCDEVDGSVYINNYGGSIIDLGSVRSISGDFIISNASNLVRVNLPKMNSINSVFGLDRLTSLTSVLAPNLSNVGVINWKVLPILSTVGFDSGIKSIKSITISDTSLIGFSGFDIEYLDVLNINNNRFLESISTNLKGIKQQLSVSANAKNILVSLPQLEWANNITVRDVSSLNLSNINSVNESLELIDNNFESVKFPNLKRIGGTLSLIENYNLKDAEFSTVEEIGGGLMIVNNTNIGKINFFPKLNVIGGAIRFIGDIKSTSFNKLKLVKGSAYIKSASDLLDCSKWAHGSVSSSGVNEFGSIVRGGKIDCTSGSKQQVVKYDKDGSILDENISIIDENGNSTDNSKSAVYGVDNDGDNGNSDKLRNVKNGSSVLSCSISLVVVLFFTLF